LTLTDLQKRPDFDPEVRSAWKDMKAEGPIREIISKQTKIGAWPGEQSYYTPKYTSTHWNLLILSELAADGLSSPMRRGSLFMLGETWAELQRRLDEKEYGLTCFWANLARYSLHCDLDDDPRLRRMLETLLYDANQGEWRCKHNDDRPCAWGAVRTLWAFALLPEHLLTKDVQAAIANGLSFLLEEHDLTKANYPVPEKGNIHAMWFRMNFPLFYQADILFVLRTLAELNALDHPGATGALDWLTGKRTRSGHWRGANPFRSRTWKSLGDRNEINRWVSLHASRVLKATQPPPDSEL
jgi:hypothetical protein